jgi:hypothetical protein
MELLKGGLMRNHKLLVVAIGFVFLYFILGCGQLSKNAVNEIYVIHYWDETAFKVDLESNLSYYCVGEKPLSTYDGIGLLENEDFPCVEELTDEKISAFLKNCDENGFWQWEELYIDERFSGGHEWSILINYSDDSVKEIIGRNAYPETWNEMFTAFKDLTGQNVLLDTKENIQAELWP